MNERIEKLWDEAADSIASIPNGRNNFWETQENFMEKFAELIVRECAGVILEEMKKTPQVHSYWGPFYDGLDSAQKMINKHFGVEE